MSKINLGVEASSWIVIVAGLALAGIAWYETTTFNAAFWVGVTAGAILVATGAWTAYDGARNEGRRSAWASALSVLAGIFVFAYPWFVNLSNLYFWSCLVIGAAVTIVSAFEIYAAMNFSSRPMRPAL